MYSMTTAAKYLKIKYGPFLANQVSEDTSPFFKEIEKTSKYAVGGSKFVMAAPIGINGGIGAISETGALPTAGIQKVENFETTQKTLTGVLKITDKAWKAAQNNEQAFVNLLTNSTQTTERGLKWDLNRQTWGNGSGVMGKLAALGSAGNTFTVTSGIANFIEGQIVDIYDYSGASSALAKKASQRMITAVVNKPGGTYTITVDGTAVTLVADGDNVPYVTMQGVTTGLEITGIEALHDSSITSLYGVTKATNPWMVPYSLSVANNISDDKILKMINYLKNYFGSKSNMIIAGDGAYEGYSTYLEATKRNVNMKDLAGGFSSISYGDKPIVNDRFAPSGNMEFVDTTKWHFHQLGDWEWIPGTTGDNNILSQVPGYAYYQATMIKHCELMCEHPGGQGRLTNCNLA
ncbi:MAG TPA: phage major capsid protein [Patescibacteria group bacterium]|nr:phage major capsid protein [Patescibacteria group bacterium]